MGCQFKTFKALEAETGTLSDTSKMPCLSTSIPAKDCNVGSFMRTIPDSVCADCYCFKGNYNFPSVKQSLENRLDKIAGEHWVEAMTEHIRRRCGDLFRWHDSGDLQSAEHLRRIVAIAKATPHILHWLPTKEYRLILTYLKHGNTFPDNLKVRVSAPMVGEAFPTRHENKTMATFQAQFEKLVLTYGIPYSTVGDDDNTADTCPAPDQDGECKDCRRCWTDRECVNYRQH